MYENVWQAVAGHSGDITVLCSGGCHRWCWRKDACQWSGSFFTTKMITSCSCWFTTSIVVACPKVWGIDECFLPGVLQANTAQCSPFGISGTEKQCQILDLPNSLGLFFWIVIGAFVDWIQHPRCFTHFFSSENLNRWGWAATLAPPR